MRLTSAGLDFEDDFHVGVLASERAREVAQWYLAGDQPLKPGTVGLLQRLDGRFVVAAVALTLPNTDSLPSTRTRLTGPISTGAVLPVEETPVRQVTESTALRVSVSSTTATPVHSTRMSA